MQTMRSVLLGEAVSTQSRKLDQLVRQGMLSPAQLPMLHRGLDKLKMAKTLSPAEREAVSKVVDSLIYIVTGDDTVFQKAKQHTQKSRYQTEATEGDMCSCCDSKIDAEGSCGCESDCAHCGGQHSMKDMKEDQEPVSPELTTDIAESIMSQEMGKGLEGVIATIRGMNAPQETIMAQDVAAVEEDDLDEIEEGVAKNTLDVATHFKNAGKSLKPSSLQGPKTAIKWRVKPPAGTKNAHPDGMQPDKVKEDVGLDEIESDLGESYPASQAGSDDDNTMMRMKKATEKREKEKRKSTLIANPKTQQVKKVTTSRAKFAVKKGFVYAEEWTDEELDALFEMDYKEKFAAMLKKSGKSLDGMSDDEKKKFFSSVDDAHKAKNEEVVESAASDARRDMKNDSKGMAPVKKSGDKGGTDKYTGSTDRSKDKHGGHIVSQLRKAITVGKAVTFKDGSQKTVSKAHAHQYLTKYLGSKPGAKVDMHTAHDSHDSFMKHINK